MVPLVVLGALCLAMSLTFAFVWHLLHRLTSPGKAIPGIPVLPVDSYADLPDDAWLGTVKRVLGLPTRTFGLAYIFGLSDQWSTLPGRCIIKKAHESLGGIFQYFSFGHVVVQISDPVAAHAVLTALDKVISPVSIGLVPGGPLDTLVLRSTDLIPRSLFIMPSGRDHALKKNTFKKCFHEAVVDAQKKMVCSVYRKFSEHLERAATDKTQVLFDVAMSSLTIESLTEVVFKFDLEKQGSSSYADLSAEFEAVLGTVWISSFPPLTLAAMFLPTFLIPFSSIRRYKLARTRIDKCVSLMWQNMLSLPPEQIESPSLIRALLDYSRQPGVGAVDVKAEIFLFLVAGHETVSHSLSWFFMLLAAHPMAQLECQQAIDQQAEGEDDAGSSQLLPPYVEAVLKESMRLFPTAGGSTRVVGKSPMTICVRKSPSSGKYEETKEEEETEVIVLPKGTYCNVNFFSLHRNKSVWGSDADEFNPSRWLGRNDAMESSHVFEGGGPKPGELSFAPFSFGHRGCIGRTFALLEMRIFITKMLKQYSFAFADPEFSTRGEDVVVEKLTARPAKSLPLLLTRRR